MAKNNPYQENKLKDFELELKDDSYYNDRLGKYIKPKHYYIGTQEDTSVGMYGTYEGKSGKKYIYSDGKKLMKTINSEKELEKISNDLYGVD